MITKKLPSQANINPTTYQPEYTDPVTGSDTRRYTCAICGDADSLEPHEATTLMWSMHISDPETGEQCAPSAYDIDLDATPADEIMCSDCVAQAVQVISQSPEVWDACMSCAQQ